MSKPGKEMDADDFRHEVQNVNIRNLRITSRVFAVDKARDDYFRVIGIRVDEDGDLLIELGERG